MSNNNTKKTNSTVAISPEVAARLDAFCKRTGMTKKDFISLSLDFFENTELTPKDADKALSWRTKVDNFSNMEKDIREINARSEQTNASVANIQGLITGTMLADMRHMIESVVADNNTRLIEEMKPHKRHWWQRKN